MTPFVVVTAVAGLALWLGEMYRVTSYAVDRQLDVRFTFRWHAGGWGPVVVDEDHGDPELRGRIDGDHRAWMILNATSLLGVLLLAGTFGVGR